MLALIGCWFDLIPASRTQDIIKTLHMGQQGRGLFRGLGKPTFDSFLFRTRFQCKYENCIYGC